ncbi:MAG TPA: hypothetical protein VFW78_11750 [Bacteroidia bacterium]|nr:hypothetical protein [Bacteroidia bacterium]
MKYTKTRSKAFSFIVGILFCLSYATQTKSQSLELQLNANTYNGGYNISCNGSFDGSIDLVVIGGTAPFTYIWSNSAVTQDINNLSAGVYTVTVTDFNGQSVSSSKTLSQPQLLSTTLNPTHVTIYGASNGRITQEVGGGTPPYTYLWNTGAVTATITNLPIGNYTVTVTDANGCSDLKSTTITQPPQLIITNFYGTNITCPGAYTGSIDAEVSGGIAPYIYSWSNGAFTQDISNLRAGQYTLRVTDQGGASIENSITLTEPSAFQIELTSPLYPNGYNVSCSECYNGSITSQVSGGTPSYVYNWYHGGLNVGSTTSLSNVGGGNYSLQILDQNNCEARKEIQLREAPAHGWSRDGNTGTNPNIEFIGNIDPVDLSFKTNNLERLKISANGDIDISGDLAIDDEVQFGNNRYIHYQPLQGSDPEIFSFGERASLNPFAITPCISPILSAQLNYQFNGTIQLYGNSSAGGFLNVMNVGFDGTNAIIEATGTSNDPLANRLLLNYYCGRDVFVGNGTSGDLTANHNFYTLGNVGIGTSTPGYKFEVMGDININGDIKRNGTSILGGLWEINSSGIHYDNGNVGIGTLTNNATHQLEVNGEVLLLAGHGDVKNGLQFLSNNGVPDRRGISIGYDNGTLRDGSFNFWIHEWQNDPVQSCSFNFKEVNNNSLLMAIHANGKVGIGGSYVPDGYTLGVHGNIIAEEIVLRLVGSWPDYVFEEDYQLRSLSDIKLFIENNHHLPGLPPANEIEESGLNIGQLISIQTQKIEELTLYLIQLKEEMDFLKLENEKLNKLLNK